MIGGVGAKTKLGEVNFETKNGLTQSAYGVCYYGSVCARDFSSQKSKSLKITCAPVNGSLEPYPAFLLCCCDALQVPVAAVSCTPFHKGVVGYFSGGYQTLGLDNALVPLLSFFLLQRKNTVIISRISE